MCSSEEQDWTKGQKAAWPPPGVDEGDEKRMKNLHDSDLRELVLKPLTDKVKSLFFTFSK